MGLRLRKTFKAGPVHINASRSGLGVSAGVKGTRVGVGPRGTRTNVSVPGTGLSYESRSSSRSRRQNQPPVAAATPARPSGLGRKLLRFVLWMVAALIVIAIIGAIF